MVGTPFWMAPELIQGSGYGVAVDVWSAGITALEMAQGEPPYFHEPALKALFRIYSAPPPTLKDPERWGNKFKSFLRMALEKDVGERGGGEERFREGRRSRSCSCTRSCRKRPRRRFLLRMCRRRCQGRGISRRLHSGVFVRKQKRGIHIQRGKWRYSVRIGLSLATAQYPTVIIEKEHELLV